MRLARGFDPSPGKARGKGNNRRSSPPPPFSGRQLNAPRPAASLAAARGRFRRGSRAAELIDQHDRVARSTAQFDRELQIDRRDQNVGLHAGGGGRLRGADQAGMPVERATDRPPRHWRSSCDVSLYIPSAPVSERPETSSWRRFAARVKWAVRIWPFFPRSLGGGRRRSRRAFPLPGALPLIASLAKQPISLRDGPPTSSKDPRRGDKAWPKVAGGSGTVDRFARNDVWPNGCRRFINCWASPKAF